VECGKQSQSILRKRLGNRRQQRCTTKPSAPEPPGQSLCISRARRCEYGCTCENRCVRTMVAHNLRMVSTLLRCIKHAWSATVSAVCLKPPRSSLSKVVAIGRPIAGVLCHVDLVWYTKRPGDRGWLPESLLSHQPGITRNRGSCKEGSCLA
jgi:hypothetical protein